MNEKQIKNKVYYGEYSLKHWIDLMLKKNIVLPDYQRFFVWDERKTKKLIETFKNNEFIPPVTIGSFIKDEQNQNIIIDGQQRLTSILLAYLDLFPDKDFFKKNREQIRIANENDDEEDDGLDDILEWSFSKLIEKGNTKERILRSLKDGNYKEVGFGIDDGFWNDHYLGFAYLVPDSKEDNGSTNLQQKYYSSVFRHINIQGVALLSQESRASLYYLDATLKPYFDPEFSNKIRLNEWKFDFVRSLALLSQCQKQNGTKAVAQGYAKRMEEYYEDYIYSVVNGNQSDLFTSFDKLFPNRDWQDKINLLEQTIRDLGLYEEKFTSIIDLDMHLFGLIYLVVFQDKKMNTEKKDLIKEEIREEIKNLKNANDKHTKNPSALKYLRMRLEKSIEIYERHTV